MNSLLPRPTLGAMMRALQLCPSALAATVPSLPATCLPPLVTCPWDASFPLAPPTTASKGVGTAGAMSSKRCCVRNISGKHRSGSRPSCGASITAPGPVSCQTGPTTRLHPTQPQVWGCSRSRCGAIAAPTATSSVDNLRRRTRIICPRDRGAPISLLTALRLILFHARSHRAPGHAANRSGAGASGADPRRRLDATLEEIYAAFQRGESVSLRNFGSFYVRPETAQWVFRFNPAQRLRKLFGWSSTYHGVV